MKTKLSILWDKKKYLDSSPVTEQYNLKNAAGLYLESPKKGQSLVELALTLPILLLLLLGVFEVGWALRSYLVLVNVNREAARFAARGVYLDFTSKQPDPDCNNDIVGEGYCPGCGGDTLNVGYCKVVSHTVDSLSAQLDLDLFSASPNAGMIVTYYNITPLEMDVVANCLALANPNHPDFNKYTQIEYPWLITPTAATDLAPSFYSKLVTYSNTISNPAYYYRVGKHNFFSRIDPTDEVVRLRAEANVHNCELKKKNQPSVPNNALIVENIYEQPQLMGFPVVTAFVPNPLPFYSHTVMRISTSIREQQTSNDEACELYPMIIPNSLLAGIQTGEVFTPTINTGWSDVQEAKLSFVYWDPTSAPDLALNLQNPTNTANFQEPDSSPVDTKISVFDWVAALPGEQQADAEADLNALVGQDLWVPVWRDIGCLPGAPDPSSCDTAKDVLGPAIQIFTFAQLRLTAVDYGASPAELSFQKVTLSPDHCTE